MPSAPPSAPLNSRTPSTSSSSSTPSPATATLLRRNYAEICENVPRLRHRRKSESGVFLGCGALHLYGPHLAEVRSIVVKPEAKGQGAGGKILRALLAEAEYQGVVAVCLFTRIPDFFFHFGFRTADRTTLPDKIYKDCQTCPRLYACDEVAMVRGPLPKIAVLGPTRIPQPELVKLQTGVIHHRVSSQHGETVQHSTK